MSAGSRSIPGEGQTARPASLPVMDALIVAVATRAFGAARAESVSQGEVKFPCHGPTGPCVLEMGHPGNHWRDSPALHFSRKQDCSICRRVHGSEVIHASE